MDSDAGVLRELYDGVRHNRWPLLILTAMVLLFFGRFLRADAVFLMRDLFLKHYPLHIFSSEVLRHGVLPLWNPYTGCGEPFLANIEGALWYPPNLLYLVMPVTLATALLVAFHTWITAVAGYALCRVWQVSWLGSLLAATMLSFNTYWLTRIEFLPSHAAIAWFPAVFLLYVLWARSRRPQWIVLAALALGFQLLAGYPEGALFPLGAIALYAVMLGVWEAREKKRRRAFLAPPAAFAAMVLLATLLAMAQILPTVELVRASSIHSGTVDPEAERASVNPLMLTTLLLPFAYGAPGYVGRYWAPSCYEYWAGSFYVGAVGIIILIGALLIRLAAIGGKAGRPPPAPAWLSARRPFLLALLALSTLYAMGLYTPVFKLLWHALPFLQKFRWPSKAMIGAVFALACLAGMALDYLSESPDRAARDSRKMERALAGWWMFAVFVIGAALVASCLMENGRVGRLLLEKYFNLNSLEWRGSIPPAVQSRIPWDILGRDAAKFAVLSLIAPVLVLLWSSRNRLRRVAGGLLVALVFADLFLVGTVLLPSGSADLLVRRGSEVAAARDAAPCRIFKAADIGQFIYGETDPALFRCAREGLAMSWPIADRVFALNGEGNFKLPGAREVVNVIGLHPGTNPLATRLLRAANVDRIVVFPNVFDDYLGLPVEPIRLAAVADPMPRAYVVGGAKMLSEGRNAVGGLTNTAFDLREAALVESAGPWAREFSGLEPGRVEHTVQPIRYGADPNALEVDLWSEREGVLVVTDTWYPGWRATVNGRETPIARVNALFRGIRVPAGNSTVLMRYSPWTVRVGVIESLAALIGILAWLVLKRSSPKT